MALRASLLLVATAAARAAECERTTLCNGEMCASVCAPGTVALDAWVDASLRFQRALQLDEPLARATLPGTHNSAITQARGFGIEQDFVANLTGAPQYLGDDLGEGVCQSLSVLDQLRLGLRHVEIDITSGYFEALERERPAVDDIFVCHTPAPDPEVVARVRLAAHAQGAAPLDWERRKLSCEGTSVPLAAQLAEVRGWLDAHPDEFVALYFDTKPFTASLPSQAASAYGTLKAAFGEAAIFAPDEGDPLGRSRRELLAAGKRVLVEDHDDGWNRPAPGANGRVLIFTPDLWSHQFGADALAPYPDCAIEGDAAWRTPPRGGGANVTRQWARALSQPAGAVEGLLKCGVQLTAGDYLAPEDMEAYVWSWARGEPAPATLAAAAAAGGGVAVVQAPGGRWVAAARGDAERLPLACRAPHDDALWTLVGANPHDADGDDEARCAAAGGLVAIPPTDGYANARLADAASASPLGGGGVRLPVLLDGTIPANRELAG